MAVSLVPAALLIDWWVGWHTSRWAHALTLAAVLAPACVSFALLLPLSSAAAMRVVNWHTPAHAETPLADLDWPLLDWVRYAAVTHIVQVFAGALFRGTPYWSFYLRANGAKLGKGVFVNSLVVTDHNLLTIGDGCVIGVHVHLSGHTVERGVLKTAPITIGRNVTIGVQSVIEIGVDIGDRATVGALSFVPKYTRLRGGTTYVGAPVHPVDENPS